MPVKELDKLTLADLWKEVKDEEGLWGDLKPEARLSLKTLMEASLLVGITQHLGAASYERTGERTDYRNGYYLRDLETAFGLIAGINVPRCRRTSYDKGVFESFKRRSGDVEQLIKDMFLAGISTRRIGEVIEPILGFSISAQTVSNILKKLDRHVANFHRRPIADQYLYLFFDGVVMKAKSGLEVAKRFCLCAYGITPSGKKELIDFCQAHSESEAAWSGFLSHLHGRGLKGLCTRLAAVDGCPGLIKALDLVYPLIPRQRCWVHKLRNVAVYLPRRHQLDCLRGAKQSYLATSEKQARARFREWAAAWQETAPRAVRCLGKDLDELLTFLSCPKEHWVKIRTTNVIERAFREVRRRTRPMSTFSNRASCDRIVYGIFCYLNKKWRDHPLKEFTHKS